MLDSQRKGREVRRRKQASTDQVRQWVKKGRCQGMGRRGEGEGREREEDEKREPEGRRRSE